MKITASVKNICIVNNALYEIMMKGRTKARLTLIDHLWSKISISC